MRYFGTVKLKDSKELMEAVKGGASLIAGNVPAEEITGIIEMNETSAKNLSPDAKKMVVIDFDNFGRWTLPRGIVAITIDTTARDRDFE